MKKILFPSSTPNTNSSKTLAMITLSALLTLGVISCNDKGDEKKQEKQEKTTPTPLPEVHKIENYSVVDGKDTICEVMYDNDYLRQYSRGGQKVDAETYFESGSNRIVGIYKSGKTYLINVEDFIRNGNGNPIKAHTVINGKILNLEIASAKAQSHAIVNEADNVGIYTVSMDGNNNFLTPTKTYEISHFRNIQDSTIGEVEEIKTYSNENVNKAILYTKDDKVLFYNSGHLIEISKGAFQAVSIKGLDKKILILETKKSGKVAVLWDNIIPYDRIGHTSSGDIVFESNGNITGFSDRGTLQSLYLGTNLWGPIKNNKLVERIWDRSSDENNKNDSVASINDIKKKPQGDNAGEHITNVSKKFANFKVKYVGVVYGEGEEYFISQDGKQFYSISYEPDENGLYTISTASGNMDNIISTLALPGNAKVSKIFAGNYYTTEKDMLYYLGEKNGIHTVQYTIAGAPGTTIQTGAEVKTILLPGGEQNNPRLIAVRGYTITLYFFNEKTKKKELLLDNTPCPKDTKIIAEYKTTTPAKVEPSIKKK